MKDRSFCLIAQLGGWGECPKAASRYSHLTAKRAPREDSPKKEHKEHSLKASLVSSGRKTDEPAVKSVSPDAAEDKSDAPEDKKDKRKKKKKRDYSISFSDGLKAKDNKLKPVNKTILKTKAFRSDDFLARRRAGIPIPDIEEVARHYKTTMYNNLPQMRADIGNFKIKLGIFPSTGIKVCNRVNLLYGIILHHISETLAYPTRVSDIQLEKLSTKITNLIYRDALHDKKAIEASIEDVICYFHKTPGIERIDNIEDTTGMILFLEEFKIALELNINENEFKEIEAILENPDPIVDVADEPDVDVVESDDEAAVADPAGLVVPGGVGVIPAAGVAAPGAPAVMAAV